MFDKSRDQNIFPSVLGWEQLDAFYCPRSLAEAIEHIELFPAQMGISSDLLTYLILDNCLIT